MAQASVDSLNADPSRFAVMRTAGLDWSASPSAGVWRKRVHHAGPEEAGQVTSVVRFDPGASFPSHDHPDGEEILVLEGVFSDETGDFPTASYLLNPEGFRHAPFSREGCVLFVKLRQYPGRTRPTRRLDTEAMAWEPLAEGIDGKPLFDDPAYPDSTWLERWAPDGTRLFPAQGGLELLILEGAARSSRGVFSVGDWVRFPFDEAVEISAGAAGATVYAKRGFYDQLTKG